MRSFQGELLICHSGGVIQGETLLEIVGEAIDFVDEDLEVKRGVHCQRPRDREMQFIECLVVFVLIPVNA